MQNKTYCDEFKSLLIRVFVPIGYQITKTIELDPVSESSKYDGLRFSLNEKEIVYRKGKVTADRPGAFLAVWQRPPFETSKGNKPIPLQSNELDYLFIQVDNYSHLTDDLKSRSKCGIFIFPTSLLIKKGIVSSIKSKGKTGFRVFPPWSQDRGTIGTKLFSDSGKKTQRWQSPFFIEIDKNGMIDHCKLNDIFNLKTG